MRRFFNLPRRSRTGGLMLLALVAVLVVGCSGTGGGWLPPSPPAFSAQASFGFSFSCERSSQSFSLNPKPARLKIQLSYSDKGSNPLGGPFSIHGEADKIDPTIESMICTGENPTASIGQLTFLGTYYPTSAQGQFGMCAKDSSSPCRFEVTVRDNDRDRAPSKGDFFSISLSSSSVQSFELDPATVIYSRAGILGGGNIKVD
jgi:hypothetical protein